MKKIIEFNTFSDEIDNYNFIDRILKMTEDKHNNKFFNFAFKKIYYIKATKNISVSC